MISVPALPQRGETHTWFGDADVTWSERDLDLVSVDERIRCARFSYDLDRSRYVAAWAGVRRVVGAYLSVSPADVRFGRSTPDGDAHLRLQPYVTTAAGVFLRLSVARSEGLWLLGLAVDDPVGVDLEHVRDFDTVGLIDRCLTAEEKRQVARLTESERGEAFVRAWTRKEAAMKAAVLSRTVSPHSVLVHPTRYGRVAVRLPGEGPRQAPRWTVQDLSLPSRGAAARAALARPAQCTGPVRSYDSSVGIACDGGATGHPTAFRTG